jgi:DNA-directed RNA polymerase specialized sigma24 family protein
MSNGEAQIRLETRVKNSRLWKLTVGKHGSVAAFCRAHPQFAQTFIGDLLNFKISPFIKLRGRTTDEYRSRCVRLACTLHVLPEDLFPRDVYTRLEGTPTMNVIEFESLEQLPLSAVEQLEYEGPSPEDAVLNRERREVILKAMAESILTEQQKRMLTMRYGLDGSVPWGDAEIARALGVTRAYVSACLATAHRRITQPLIRAKAWELT